MAHLITGAQGQAHITPKNDAVIHRGMMGVESCILDYGEKLAPALIPSQPTNIRILDGCGMMQGRFFEIEEGSYDTIAIPNGAQGYNRIDLVCAKITQNENGTQSFSWEVVQGTQTTGTPTPPTVAEGSLDDGDEFALMPIASVELEGVNIVAVETVAEVLGGIERVLNTVNTVINWASENLFITHPVVSDSVSIAGNSNKDFSIPIPNVDGYAPLAIGGAYPSGTNLTGIVTRNWFISAGQVRFSVRNVSSSSSTMTLTAIVIYVKTITTD